MKLNATRKMKHLKKKKIIYSVILLQPATVCTVIMRIIMLTSENMA